MRSLRTPSSLIGLSAFLALAPASLWALDPARLPSQYGIRAWDSTAGLPSGAINAITQDADHYLWLGTAAGPVRFNGVSFTTFSSGTVPGLPDGAVTSLALGADGAVWMGTATGGLARCFKGQFVSQPSDAGGAITGIAPDPQGGAFVASLSSLNHVEHGTRRALPAIPTDYQAVIRSHDGTLWVGMRGRGLVHLEEREGTTTIAAEYHESDGLSGNIVTSLHEDAAGDLWIGTTSGLSWFHGGKFTRFTAKDGLSNDLVGPILSDRDGNVWVGTRGGLSRIRQGHIDSFRQSDGLNQSDVRALFIDHEGSLWAGTSGGLVRISDSLFITYGSPEGILEPRVRAVTAGRDNSVWVGTDSGGVFRIQAGRVTPLEVKPPLPKDSVLVLREAPDGALWIGMDGGPLFRAKDGVLTNETATAPEGVGKVSLAIVLDGVLVWAARGGGVGTVQNHIYRTILPQVPLEMRVYHLAVHRDKKGTYWLGMGDGLLRVRDGIVTRLASPTGAPLFSGGARVRWIHEDEDGRLWLATQDGLACLKNDQVLKTLTHADGLPEDYLRSILEDDAGNFWIASAGRIFTVPRRDLVEFAEGKRARVSPIEFDRDDGLRSLECPLGHTSAVRLADGTLWFVTADGVSMVDPAHHRQSVPPPQVHIDGINVDGTRTLSPSYPPGRGNVEIRFSALSFRAPEKTTFLYKLEGIDEGWVKASTENSARYARLGPGTYTFSLIALSRNGAFPEQRTALTFSLERHWYQTWWWYGGAGTALLGVAGLLGFGVHRLRVRSLRQEQVRLSREVEARTADLAHANQELARANGDLARASRLKDEFLANMSHELRTPLNAILSSCEVLDDGCCGELTAQQKEFLSMVDQSGRHLLSLINDVLDLSKIEASRFELQIVPMSVSSVVQASLSFVVEQAHRKSLTIRTSLEPDLPFLIGDERRVKQILINLLSNSVKFTPEGGQVGIEAARDRRSGTLRLTVWDTGIGIAADDLRRLFRPFVQVDSGLSRQHEGTGLGLALVSRMVSLHGGSLTVESEPGVGSRFHVFLPCQEMDAAAEVTDEAEGAPVIVHPRRVLVVDNNEHSVKTLTRYLGTRGYEVLVARDGVEALDMLNAKRPEVVLMDIQLPRMDGLEATRRIRSDATWANIPIIALTSLAMPGDRERCLAAGADDYQSKPISLKRLVFKIEKHCAGRTQSAGTATQR